MIVSRSVLLIMKMLRTKVVETIKTHILCSGTFFSENRTVYGIMWKNILERVSSNMTLWRMCIACCITKATNTYSEYVIIIAFPLQQRLHELASLLRYTYMDCLVTSNIRPGPVWTGGKSRPHRDSISDRPARSRSLYRLIYPSHNRIYVYIYI